MLRGTGKGNVVGLLFIILLTPHLANFPQKARYFHFSDFIGFHSLATD